MAKRPEQPPAPKAPRPHSPYKVWNRLYLRDWREFRGLSTEKLAELSGVSPGLISQIENRRSAGSADSLEKLAKALAIEVGELLDVKPEKGGRVLRVFVSHEDHDTVRRMIEALSKSKS